MKFHKELYPKVALIKAAYNFTDTAYVHLDADDDYYYVTLIPKGAEDDKVDERRFVNEILAQCVRHEVYLQTKNIRELLLARAMATSVIVDEDAVDADDQDEAFAEEDILQDWFSAHEDNH